MKFIKFEIDTRQWLVGVDSCDSTAGGQTYWVYFLCCRWTFRF